MTTKVKVVGTGGIGLCLLPTLARFLNFSVEKFNDVELSLIDGDTYEEKNRDRQDFDELGAKATVTANGLRNKFPRLNVYDHPIFLDESNIVRHIRENDIILLCVDNHKSRKMVSDRASELNNVSIISGGNDRIDGNVLIHLRRDGKNLTCPMDQYHPEIANPNDLHPNEMNQVGSCSRMAESQPQLVIMNNLIAANMLAAFYTLTDSEGYGNIVKNPVRFGEIYSSLHSVASVPRDRFPKN